MKYQITQVLNIKSLTGLTALLTFATLGTMAGCTKPAVAKALDGVNVTPKVGYSFNTSQGDNAGLKTLENRDAAMVGLGVTKALPKGLLGVVDAVEVEAFKTNNDYKTRTVAVNAIKNLPYNAYVLVGVGHTDNKLGLGSTMVQYGVGYKYVKDSIVTPKVEIRSVHQIRQGMHEAQALVGLDFKLK